MSPHQASSKQSTFWQSFLLSLFFLILFFLVNKPVISAFEDLHVQYLLTGGYGQPPSLQLFYLYGWHSFLFSPVYLLYRWLPNINWYGIFLLLLQWIAHLLLIYQIVSRVGFVKSFAFYLVFFLLFGFPFLQKLELSTTGSLLTLAACASLLLMYRDRVGQKNNLNKKEELIAITILLISFLLRIHTGLLLLFISILASFVVLERKYRRRFILVGLVTVVVSLALFEVQHLIYRSDPQYNSWKATSDLYYATVNRPNLDFIPSDSVLEMEGSFIRNHYLIDSSLTTEDKMTPFFRRFSSLPISITKISSNKEALFWTYQNNRLTLALILVLLISSLVLGGFNSFKNSLLLLTISAGTWLGLLVFFKIREHVTLSFSAFFFLLVFVEGFEHFKNKDRVLMQVILVAVLLLGCWRTVQQLKTKSALETKIQQTHSYLRSCSSSSEYLFINISNERWEALSAFDSPRQFPLKNVLTREMLTTGKFLPLFKRYKIRNLVNELVDHPKIIILGRTQPDWFHYYLWRQSKTIEMIPVPTPQGMPGFQLRSRPM